MNINFPKMLEENDFVEVLKKNNRVIFGHTKWPVLGILDNRSNSVTLIGYGKITTKLQQKTFRWREKMSTQNKFEHRHILNGLEDMNFKPWPLRHTRNSILENKRHLFSKEEIDNWSEEKTTLEGSDMIFQIQKKTKIPLTEFSFERICS